MRGMDKGQSRTHGCHRRRRSKRQSSHSCRPFREEHRSGAYWASKFGRVLARSPYSSQRRRSPQAYSSREQLCMQVVSSSTSGSRAAKLQGSDPVCFINRVHNTADQQSRNYPQGPPSPKVMRLPYTRVQVKHLSIPQKQMNYNFKNVYTGSLPDLVVVGLVDDADFAGSYQRNPFNFQNFGVNRMELRPNETPVPRSS